MLNEIAQHALASQRRSVYCSVTNKHFVRYKAYSMDRSWEITLVNFGGQSASASAVGNGIGIGF